MKKILLFPIVLFLTAIIVPACSDDEEDIFHPETNDSISSGDSIGGDSIGNVLPSFYIVNQGSWEYNNASLQVYDPTLKNVSSPDCNSDIFYAANGELLGDLAQDLLWVGDKLFVTVSSSQKLEILDETGKRVKKYNYAAEGAQPRYMATDGENVYVTNYDGFVYVYDAATGDSLTQIYAGSYPEGISYLNGSIVVNNSNWGGYGGGVASVAIIDVASGEAKIIKENVCNPYTQSVVCGGKVYIIDSGNYMDILSAVYCVDVENEKLVKVADNATLMSADEDCIYYVNANWNYAINGYEYSALFKLDVATGEKCEVLPAEKMTNVASLDVEPETGDVYVGFSSEANDYGTMRVYGADGEQKDYFEVGYYTSGARFRN